MRKIHLLTESGFFVQLNLQIKNLNVPLHSHLKNGLLIRLKDVLKKTDAKINFKNFAIKFGSFKIMRTFAAPFEKRVLERGFESSLKRLDYCTRSKYREKQFIEKR